MPTSASRTMVYVRADNSRWGRRGRNCNRAKRAHLLRQVLKERTRPATSLIASHALSRSAGDLRSPGAGRRAPEPVRSREAGGGAAPFAWLRSRVRRTPAKTPGHHSDAQTCCGSGVALTSREAAGGVDHRREVAATLVGAAPARGVRFVRVARCVREAAAAPPSAGEERATATCAQAVAGGRGSALVGARVDPESAGGQRGQDADPPRQPLVRGWPHRLGQFHRRSTYPRRRLLAPAARV